MVPSGANVPEGLGVGLLLTDAAVGLGGVPSWAPVWTGVPPSTGMSWKPMAAPVSPWVNRTNHFILPESSMPQACSERE